MLSYDPVFLIGAYERDNFGDLLFGIVTDAALQRDGFSTRWTAPHVGTCNDLLERDVEAYPRVLPQSPAKAIWTVGGEVGGMTSAACRALYPGEDSTTSEFELSTPYLPNPTAFPDHLRAPTVVNSVGLSSMRRASLSQFESDLLALRSADFVSVRDKGSSELLTELGIVHRLAPDVVQALPRLVDLPPIEKGEYLLFQCVAYELPEAVRQTVAEELAAISIKYGLEVRFFAAGAAPLHDSKEVYLDIAERIRALIGTLPEVISERHPLSLVTQIAGCRLWIGSSLHGRVLSSTFDIPRVGLRVEKLTNYAAQWDPQFPANVRFTALQAASEAALQLGSSVRIGERLGDAALANLESAIEHLCAQADESAAERVERRARHQAAAVAALSSALQQAEQPEGAMAQPQLSEDLRAWTRDSFHLGRRMGRAAKKAVKRWLGRNGG